MRDSARQQKVNFLMWDLVTALLALILLLGLFCRREKRVTCLDLARLRTLAAAGVTLSKAGYTALSSVSHPYGM